MNISQQVPQRLMVQTCAFLLYAGEGVITERSPRFKHIESICRDWQTKIGVTSNFTLMVLRDTIAVNVLIMGSDVDADALTQELGYALIAGLGLEKIFRHLNGEEGYLQPPAAQAEMRDPVRRLN